jgi:zinc transport system permease protein
MNMVSGGFAALPLPWPFEREYMQLALVAGLVIGVCAPLVGTFLVQRRLSLMGDGMGHLAFAGVALGVVLNIWPIWTALVFAVVGAIGVERVRRRSRESGDLALALIFYAGIAAGTVLLGLDHSLNANLLSYLFGSILTVSRADVVTVVCVGFVIVAVLAVAGRALFAIVIDDEAAEVAGLPVARLNDLFAVLTAVTVVAAMRIVGILLISALMVLPVGAGQALTKSFRGLLLVSSAIGGSCAVLGLVLARVQGLAPGGTVVLLAAATYATSALVVPRVRARARRSRRPGPVAAS